jgi:molybdopterin converting factor small subunit
MSRIKIPPVLRPGVGGVREIETGGATVGEALESLFAEHGELRDRLMQDGDLRRFVNVYLDDEDVRTLDGLATPVREGGQLTILPAVAGG